MSALQEVGLSLALLRACLGRVVNAPCSLVSKHVYATVHSPPAGYLAT